MSFYCCLSVLEKCLEKCLPVQIPLGSRLGLGTHPRYKAPGDLRVEIVEMQWLTLGECVCPLANGPKLAVGQPNRHEKKFEVNTQPPFFSDLLWAKQIKQDKFLKCCLSYRQEIRISFSTTIFDNFPNSYLLFDKIYIQLIIKGYLFPLNTLESRVIIPHPPPSPPNF